MQQGRILERFTLQQGSLLPLGFFRLILAFMLWRHAWYFLYNHSADRFYQDKFHLPYFNWYPLPSEGFYLFLLCLMIVAGLMLLLGVRTREAAWLAFSSVTFHLLLNQFWYRHNRYFFLLMLLLLAVGPVHRVFTRETRGGRPVGRTWVYFMIRLQMSLTYLASAFAKSLDKDWQEGHVLKKRLDYIFREDNMGDENLPFQVPQWFQDFATSDFVGNTLTILALGQEYFLAFCLWIPQTRKLALWVGLLFHGSIELGANVLVFSYASMATYFAVIRPTTGDRRFYYNPARPGHLKLVRILQLLDWLNKLSFYTIQGDNCFIEDRDGKKYRGWFSLVIAGSCMVIPYVLAYPLSWMKHLGTGRCGEIEDNPQGPVTVHKPRFSWLAFVGVTTGSFVAYQLLMLLIVNRITPFDLQDLSGFDGLVMVGFFFATWYYYSFSQGDDRSEA